MDRSAGTPIAYCRSMDPIARAGAVFLLVGLVWVSGVLADEGNRRGHSQQQTKTKQTVGVGTQQGLQQGDSGVREESPVTGVASLAVFREVETGWRAGTPKPFEKYFGKGKVRLDFGEGGPRGGLFARSQAYYLITDYLKGTQTLDIGFTRVSDGIKSGTKPYALLERGYRDKNGISRREVVFISLSLEDGLWVITELRAIPAK